MSPLSVVQSNSSNAHKRVVVFSSLADFISLSTFIGKKLASEPVSSLNRMLFPCTFSIAYHFCSVIVDCFPSVTVPTKI